MTRIFGLVIALPKEARAVVGKGNWRQRDRFWVHRQTFSPGAVLFCVRAGIGTDNALHAARWLAGQGVSALGVTGISGGLQTGLQPGDLVVADRVHRVDFKEAERDWPVAADFAALSCRPLVEQGMRVFRGPILTRATPVFTPAEKQTLFTQTGALAVDMESASVARAAEEAGLPFFALRVVCDPPERSIPPAVLDALSQNGTPQPAVLLGKFLRRPLLAVDLIRLRKDFAAALKSLRRCWQIHHGDIPPALFRERDGAGESVAFPREDLPEGDRIHSAEETDRKSIPTIQNS